MRSVKRHLQRTGLALIAGITLISLCLYGQRDGRARTEEGFVYFLNPEMDFMKLEEKTLALQAYWSFPLTRGLSDVLPLCTARSNCLTAKNFSYDGRGRLWGVFPQSPTSRPASDAKPASGGNPGELGDYQVIGMALPDFRIVARIPVPESKAEPPSLLVTPDGNNIFIEYRDARAESDAKEPSIVTVLDVYNARSLKKELSIHDSALVKDYESGADVLPSRFSSAAYFSADGKYIFDGLNRLEISGEHATKTFISPLTGLGDSQRAALAPFTKTVAGKPFYEFHNGDSASGRTLVWVTDTANAKLAIWTTDLRTGQDTPVIVSPFGLMHLSHDGSKVIVEETASKTVNGQSTAVKTGRVLIYDAGTGKQLNVVDSDSTRGPAAQHKTVCMTPDGERLFGVSREGVYAVSLSNGAAEKLHASFPANPGTTCVFAER